MLLTLNAHTEKPCFDAHLIGKENGAIVTSHDLIGFNYIPILCCFIYQPFQIGHGMMII
jgi:hypothetical protein